MTTVTTPKSHKKAHVLNTYRFHHVVRICFETLSSNGVDKYHTCFQGDGRESCTCPAHGGCYHRDDLRPLAQAYFNETVSVQVGNTTVMASRKNLANAVGHTKWSQEITASPLDETAASNLRAYYNGL